MYFFLLLEENTIFRRFFHHLYTKEFADGSKTGERYNWEIWNDATKLTHGLAGGIAFCCGIGGAVCGMAQVYFIGPVAKYFGDYGGDVGMWLSMAFSGVVYVPLRYWELKRFGR